MKRVLLVGIVYVVIALGMDQGFLPLFGEASQRIHWSELRLLPVGIILFGCLCRDYESMLIAVLAAIPFGAVIGPGYVGSSMVSFTLAAYLSYWAARLFYLESFIMRWLVIFGIAAAECWIWSIVHHAFWHASPIEMQWQTLAVTGFIGAVLYRPVAFSLRYKKPPPEPIGRRKREA